MKSSTRRTFLAGLATAAATPLLTRLSHADTAGRPLPVPPVMETHGEPVTLDAISGSSIFQPGLSTPTLGFSQPYLGPTLRFRRGTLARVNVRNRLNTPITSHWHGLHVPAILDGGPQLQILPERQWSVEMPIDQPAATLWYHSHVHGRTAEQVYQGLAGMIIVDDPSAPDSGLPVDYGVDDLPLIIQDRAFREDGAFHYANRGPARMIGFRGDTILVNGAIRPVAAPPTGLVRLRLLNGSNSRTYLLRFSDERGFHQVASDGGLLPKPVPLTSIQLAPAERAEILVDFSDGRRVTMLSGPDHNNPMGRNMPAMMRQMLGGDPAQFPEGKPGEFEILSFEPHGKPRAAGKIPDAFPGAPRPQFGDPARTRELVLNMHADGRGPGMPRGGQPSVGQMGSMGINDNPFSMDRVDIAMNRGETELWTIRAAEMKHPFHVHGTSFQVLHNGRRDVAFDSTGLKDIVLVEGEARILVRCNHVATPDIPYMFHCHILEHEDAGMMGQFTVA
ncbi:MAG: multicopper oxidase domain-containing protein [Rhodospirillaceae bacterium]|jgi:blue copper oxidase|nr:multicopper oxidase domain-containing protein [Rhodospirillaceae bacterium]MBT5943250.1 multicopper oxidase domain-containing protein [Rhodospirillaceae bacterium]MBT6405433.1 multicopper oxidase domain-containing protein [Rhodospirillaceae bacterium]MBT6535351.1 multicopper oxidase domain-containing protein [Rhodospirillaceae bacterium]